MRKSRQLHDAHIMQFIRSAEDPVCPLCERPIPASQQDDHHLIPRLKKGKETQVLHRACHRQVHAVFSETELARTYNSPEMLLTHPEIRKFVDWIKTKPNDFLPQVKAHQRRK